jgi:hypothetical protein
MMQDSPDMIPGPAPSRNRRYPLLQKIWGISLAVVYFCVGAALVLLSYLVWENNDVVEKMAGSALFLVGGAGFITLGIKSITKWRRGQ